MAEPIKLNLEDVAMRHRAMLNSGVGNSEAAATLVAAVYIVEAVERATESLVKAILTVKVW